MGQLSIHFPSNRGIATPLRPQARPERNRRRRLLARRSVRTGLAMTAFFQTPIYRTKGLPGVFGEALRGSICFPAGFPCAPNGSRGAWDLRLPREPAFFLLPSWHSPRVQYAPDGGNHAHSGEELLPKQLLHILEPPRREGAFQVRLLQKCQEIGLPGVQVP